MLERINGIHNERKTAFFADDAEMKTGWLQKLYLARRNDCKTAGGRRTHLRAVDKSQSVVYTDVFQTYSQTRQYHQYADARATDGILAYVRR